MARFELALFAIGLLLAVWAISDIVSTDESQVPGLPKIVWVLLCLVFPVVGSLVWLVTRRRAGLTRAPRRPRRPGGPGRSGRPPAGPDDDPDFLRGL